MIQEDYVSFETAKLLKEKEFNEPCYTCYLNKELSHYDYLSTNFELIDNAISAPTLQMACKWLREVHNLFIFPFPQMNTNKFWTEVFQLSNNQEWENLYCESIDLQDYPTYEKAVEAALKYSLENLI